MKARKTVAAVLLMTVLLSLFAGALAAEAEDSSSVLDATSEPAESPSVPVTESELEVTAPPPPYEPVWDDFTDVSGHWAESTLKKGFNDGLIKGFDNLTLRPDDVITTAQMITILTRVLGATQQADISSWELDPESWFYEAVGKAAFLGLVDSTVNPNAPMTRQDAFSMIARAFALIPTAPDLSVLDAFSDVAYIKTANKPAIAALVAAGLAEGFDGALDVNGSMTRAQFLTLLYRVTDSATPSDKEKNIVITGNDQSVTIEGEYGNVVVSGSTNHVIISKDAKISTLIVSGMGNWLTLSCTEMTEINISGDYNTLEKTPNDSPGAVYLLDVGGGGNRFFIERGNLFENISVSGVSNTFYLNSNVANMTISGYNTQIDGIENGHIENLTVNASGCGIYISVTNRIDNSRDYDADRVLELVTGKYAGDYTLAWAEANDYEAYEKEIWVNEKGYSSNTEYLIWVSLAMQRVNIFTGSTGAWELERSCIIASGAPGSGTPPGVYYTTYKLAAGWTTSTYTCRPVVGFKTNSGYAFHSRLYYPNSNTLTDPSIGYPVSHGCIRMYDEDINFIYDSIPLGTTVVVY